MSGHKVEKMKEQPEYDPKYDFVFKRTVYVGVPFEKSLTRSEQINRTICYSPFLESD